jgi:hypothetical protein
MTVFKAVPELNWLKKLAETSDNGAFKAALETVSLDRQNPSVEDKLIVLYRFLLWQRRMSLAHPQSDEYKVAFGLSTKYHRWLFEMDLTDYEQKLVTESEALYKTLRKALSGKA